MAGSSQVRVRRHTDGRVVIHTGSCWAFCWLAANRTMNLLCDEDVVGEGWVDLLVTELPGPDGHGESTHDDSTPPGQWQVSCLGEVDGAINAWVHGIQIDGRFLDAEDGEIDALETEALKLLAAIAEHRRLLRGQTGT